MANDLKHALDEKIRKLQAFRDLADDPDMLAMIKDFMDNSTKPAEAPARKAEPGQSTLLLDSIPLRKRPRRGEQQRATEEALAQATEPVGTEWVVERMKQNGFVFLAAKPRVAVNECLREAERKGRAEISKTIGIENYWTAKK